jgi:hypothetical protein
MKLISKRNQKRFHIRWRRLFSKLDRRFSSQEKLTDIQLTAITVARRLITNPSSNLNYAPISSTCYVENARYYIRLADNAITVTNGKFSYYVWLPSKESDSLRSLFYRILEGRKNSIDKRYDQTTLNNLREIAESLKLER